MPATRWAVLYVDSFPSTHFGESSPGVTGNAALNLKKRFQLLPEADGIAQDGLYHLVQPGVARSEHPGTAAGLENTFYYPPRIAAHASR